MLKKSHLPIAQKVPVRNYNNLLRLLGGSRSRDIAGDVGSFVALAHDTLESLPTLAELRGGALVGDRGVSTGSELANSLLHERALGVAGAEEGKVYDQQDPATLGESDSGQHETEQQGDLKGGNDAHAGIVVLLDEAANGLGELGLLAGRLGVGRAGGTRAGGLALALGLGLEGRDQVHATIGSDVEDRVDTEGQEGENELARV